MKSITVLTPTYNRAELLNRCYLSLLNQTCKDFEWIIIDDGSTDHTQEVVDKFITENTIDVQYVKKENGGKHTALNLGFEIADSMYLIILDSDDELVPEAVEIILSRWNSIKDTLEIGAAVFLKAGFNKKTVGKPFPVNGEIISKFQQLYIGDKAEVFRTNLLKNYRYPEFKGEYFIGESYVWDQVAQKYKFAYFNDIIYLCEYLEEGLTNSGWRLRIKNPKGGMAFNNQRMTMPYSLSVIVKSVLLFIVFGCISGKNYSSIIRKSNRKPLTMLLFPVGWMMAKILVYRYK